MKKIDEIKQKYTNNEISSEQALQQVLDLFAVMPSLPTDECIEEWWAAGQDKIDKNFWKDAPYRTNGDVIEQIKEAVKYFIGRWNGNEA